VDEELIGKVTHFFPRIGVAAIEVTAGEVRIGDTIRVLGATSNFTQQVESMQVDHVPIESASVGEVVAVRVTERARVNDVVFRIRPHVAAGPGPVPAPSDE
jgi:putative protease